MKKETGLWIDHRKAVIVVVTDQGEETRLIKSKADKQLRRELADCIDLRIESRGGNRLHQQLVSEIRQLEAGKGQSGREHEGEYEEQK